MQAHPLSTTAARTPSLSHSPGACTALAQAPAANLTLPPPLQLPGPRAAPHLGRPAAPLHAHFGAPSGVNRAYAPVAERAGLAHDAGNLLGALRLYSDLLSSPGVLRPEHSHYAADLRLIAARSSALIERLLAGAAGHHETALPCQPDAVETQPPARAVHPAAALRALAPVLERIAAGSAHVTVAIAGGLPRIDLPAEALERIAVNLVRNAAEAIRSSRQSAAPQAYGHIQITLESVGGCLRLSVEDDGPGMPPAVAAAFLRPGQLPTGATRGLGHRIVHELAAETGAKLSIRVRPGRGTAFCLRWPLGDDPGQPTGLEPLHQARAAATYPHSTGSTVPC